jgi:ribosomal protein S18 acetylase RimI-like enzyme
MRKPRIRLLRKSDVLAYRDLRLNALGQNPEAFGASLAESITVPLEDLEDRITSSERSLVFGAFAPELIGIVGLTRRNGSKLQHKATIWGMYVSPEARGKGIARALMERAIERAKDMPYVEEVVLSVVTSNQIARELYTSLGFASYGYETRALRIGGTYLDEELMSLYLGESSNQSF